jgi:hypothetical protein
MSHKNVILAKITTRHTWREPSATPCKYLNALYLPKTLIYWFLY